MHPTLRRAVALLSGSNDNKIVPESRLQKLVARQKQPRPAREVLPDHDWRSIPESGCEPLYDASVYRAPLPGHEER